MFKVGTQRKFTERNWELPAMLQGRNLSNTHWCVIQKIIRWRGGKESTYQCRRHKRCGLDPWVPSQDQEDGLEEEMPTHSRILVWKIPWTEEPGGIWLGTLAQHRRKSAWWTKKRCETGGTIIVYINQIFIIHQAMTRIDTRNISCSLRVFFNMDAFA